MKSIFSVSKIVGAVVLFLATTVQAEYDIRSAKDAHDLVVKLRKLRVIEDLAEVMIRIEDLSLPGTKIEGDYASPRDLIHEEIRKITKQKTASGVEFELESSSLLTRDLFDFGQQIPSWKDPRDNVIYEPVVDKNGELVKLPFKEARKLCRQRLATNIPSVKQIERFAEYLGAKDGYQVPRFLSSMQTVFWVLPETGLFQRTRYLGFDGSSATVVDTIENEPISSKSLLPVVCFKHAIKHSKFDEFIHELNYPTPDFEKQGLGAMQGNPALKW